MVKIWFICDGCHDSIKNMFFVVRNGHYQEFSHIVCIPLLYTYI